MHSNIGIDMFLYVLFQGDITPFKQTSTPPSEFYIDLTLWIFAKKKTLSQMSEDITIVPKVMDSTCDTNEKVLNKILPLPNGAHEKRTAIYKQSSVVPGNRKINKLHAIVEGKFTDVIGNSFNVGLNGILLPCFNSQLLLRDIVRHLRPGRQPRYHPEKHC